MFFKKRSKEPKATKKVIEKQVFEESLNHAPTIRDMMTVADGMEVEKTRIYIAPSGYTRLYFVSALPETVHFGYLDQFFNLGADVHVTLHVEPADKARAVSKRTKMMTRLQSEINAERNAGTNKNIEHNRRMYSLLEEEREAIATDKERMFFVTIIFSVTSPKLDEFNAACERIERKGFVGYSIREAFKEHDVGYKAVAPIGENALKHSIEMTSTALANAFPFTNSRFSHEYGVPIGIDWTTGRLNAYDAWGTGVNANMFIIGASGAGKSVLLKGLTARSTAYGILHLFVDYEGEYGTMVRELGGITIRVDARSPYKFNPFELEDVYEKQDDGSIRHFVDVLGKISEMERLITSMAQAYGGELTRYEHAVINDLLQVMYQEDFGFTEDPTSLYETLSDWTRNEKGDRLVKEVKRPQPQFGNFYSKLVKQAEEDLSLRELVMSLRRFKAGGTEGMFDTQTVFPKVLQGKQLKDAHIIHFDLSTLPDQSVARDLGMQVIMEFVMEKYVKKDIHIRKRVVLDEAQEMLKEKVYAQFIADWYRRIRKRGGSVIAATQDFRKFGDNEFGRSIVINSATRVLLRQDEKDKEMIMDVFRMEEHEFEELTGFVEGKARWMVANPKGGNEVFYNQFVAFGEENEFVSTTFTKSEAQLAKERRVG